MNIKGFFKKTNKIKNKMIKKSYHPQTFKVVYSVRFVAYCIMWHTLLCSATSRQARDLCEDAVYGRTAYQIIGTTLPTLQELYSSRLSKGAVKVTLDPSHPAHSLFEMLPSGRRYRALRTRTTRNRNSFFPQAIHLMNTTIIIVHTLFIHLIHLFI